MAAPAYQDVLLWPLAVYFGAVVVLVAGMLLVSHLLGSRHRQRATVEPFESGMPPTGTARLRFSANYYLVAVFFVIFDLETVLLVAWAIAARQVGWSGYIEVLVFTSLLLVALVYLWRMGALDWDTSGTGHPEQEMP